MNLLTDLLPWFMWLVGLLGVAGAILFVAFVPGGLTILVEFLKPWARFLGDVTAGYARTLWSGLLDIFDNFKTIITAVTFSALFFVGGYQYASWATPSISEDVRIEYKLVKRTQVEKRAYLKKIGKSDFTSWWRSWF